MPPSGECPRRIAPATAMVEDFKKKKNTNKTQLLASFLKVEQRQKLSNLKTRWGPSTHVLSTTSPNCNPYTTS